jgi:hypothetical protein
MIVTVTGYSASLMTAAPVTGGHSVTITVRVTVTVPVAVTVTVTVTVTPGPSWTQRLSLWMSPIERRAFTKSNSVISV